MYGLHVSYSGLSIVAVSQVHGGGIELAAISSAGRISGGVVHVTHGIGVVIGISGLRALGANQQPDAGRDHLVPFVRRVEATVTGIQIA